MKLITGKGDPLVGRLLIFDALQMDFPTVKVRWDADCPVCGKEPTITELIDYEAFCGLAPGRPRPRPSTACRPDERSEGEDQTDGPREAADDPAQACGRRGRGRRRRGDAPRAAGDLEERYPGITKNVVTEDGGLHRFVNVYVNDEDVRYLGSLETAVKEGDTVSILPAVAGG